MFCTFLLANVLLATTACNFSTSQLQKVAWDRQFFNILTSKCASRYSGVQFFNIATSKSGPSMQCFVHFDLKMCFSLQRRAIFPHLNFKKWPETVSFLTYWLANALLATAACNFSTPQLQKVVRTCSERRILIENVLLATAACNFSTSQLQKVVRDRQFFTILTWKCASRHSGVQFFNIATSKNGPSM